MLPQKPWWSRRSHPTIPAGRDREQSRRPAPPHRRPQAANPAGAADKPAAAAAFAEPVAGTDAATELAKVAAPNNVDTSDSADGTQTAAIPEVQPEVPPQQPSAAGDAGNQVKAKPQKAAATGTGRILRPVTMRSGPKTSAAAIVTVPAKTSVQLVSCKQWCEIVYNGKHGWVYKSYIKPGA
ncbi:SH3 domain-containing protein [Mesorhizobium sp. PAMC28654]|uniref:SH3 domain-containing protein n=1 Tax=Mesorhizobium sp. PAMC28654 TaxID=2880934 RepID=UPI001D0BAE52|nr:SH3 domain-containing protein [Mesorhizobium sp. PAMC28654]UDL92157.1 SH3 domain-containing protein [Mesorhizobium sp. PAMC28654]